MKRHIVLSGEIGAGKTTLIRRALGERLRFAGGFATVRVTEGGALSGFELVSAPELLSGNPRGARFLDFTRGKSFDADVFRTLGAQLLREAGAKPFAVIDEVGGMELLIPEFCDALTSLLRSDAPWICVIKTPEAVGALERTVNTGCSLTAKVGSLRSALGSDPEALSLTVRERGDAAVAAALGDWAEEYAIQSR